MSYPDDLYIFVGCSKGFPLLNSQETPFCRIMPNWDSEENLAFGPGLMRNWTGGGNFSHWDLSGGKRFEGYKIDVMAAKRKAENLLSRPIFIC
jgi:hypothetical protein